MDAIVGNHDLRIAKATQGQITIDMLIEDTGVQLGQYSYLYLWNPTTQEWTYVCHQFNYSKTSVKLAQDVWTVVTAPDGYDNATGSRVWRASVIANQRCTYRIPGTRPDEIARGDTRFLAPRHDPGPPPKSALPEPLVRPPRRVPGRWLYLLLRQKTPRCWPL